MCIPALWLSVGRLTFSASHHSLSEAVRKQTKRWCWWDDIIMTSLLWQLPSQPFYFLLPLSGLYTCLVSCSLQTFCYLPALIQIFFKLHKQNSTEQRRKGDFTRHVNINGTRSIDNLQIFRYASIVYCVVCDSTSAPVSVHGTIEHYLPGGTPSLQSSYYWLLRKAGNSNCLCIILR